MSKSIAQILKMKGSDVWSIAPDAKIYDALALMAEKNVGALVVMEAERLIGLFTERDHSRKGCRKMSTMSRPNLLSMKPWQS
jgi:CBS domain-containing protein